MPRQLSIVCLYENVGNIPSLRSVFNDVLRAGEELVYMWVKVSLCKPQHGNAAGWW